MDADDLASHLNLLGLDTEDAQVYRALLDSGSAGVDELADAQGLPEDAVYKAISDLIDAGLVGRTSAGGDRYAPVPPEAGLKVMTARRESEINAAMVATLNAYADFRRSRLAPSTDHLVDVVTGPAMLERVE